MVRQFKSAFFTKVLTAVLIVLGIPASAAAQEINLIEGPGITDPSTLIIQFRSHYSRKKLSDFCKANLVNRERVFPGLEALKIDSGKKRARILNRLKELRSDIKFAEYNQILTPDFIPNDANYSSQWFHPKIDDEEAWDTTFGSSEIIIAIVDTGVDGTHPDLAANMVPGRNIYDNNSDASDVYGHGTAVAGNAAMVGNNNIGGAGVCPGCKIMPIRISATNGTASSLIAMQGVIWAADHGARVANVSYNVAGSPAMESAGDYLMARGGVLTVSAGNYNTNVNVPSSTKLLTVGSVNSNDQKSSFSNYGQFLAVMAPGEGMYLTNRGGGYGSWAGTSFSAPTAAGVVGLIFSANPSLTAAQAMDIIKSSADDLGAPGFDTTFGWGRVNSHSAIIMATSGNPPPTATATPTSTPTFTSTPTSVPSNPTPSPTPTVSTPEVPTPIPSATSTPEIDPIVEVGISIAPSVIKPGGKFTVLLTDAEDSLPLPASVSIGSKRCGDVVFENSFSIGRISPLTPPSRLSIKLENGNLARARIKKGRNGTSGRIGSACKALLRSFQVLN